MLSRPRLRRPANVVALVASMLAGCSLIVPSSSDFRFGDDGGPSDAGRDDATDAGCPDVCGGECTDTRSDPMHCGSCTRSCSAPDHASATCIDAVCNFDCAPGYTRIVGTCVAREAPRPISPLSTSRVTQQRPTLEWELTPGSTGARIEICEDRACLSVLQTIDASGASGRPTLDLDPGVKFWRLYARDDADVGTVPSETWEFWVPHRSADAADTSFGSILDLNGDGFPDVAIGAPRAHEADGAVFVFMGSGAGLQRPPIEIVGPAGESDRFGGTVHSVGDVNGDGFGELAVSVDGLSREGSTLFLYLGSADGIDTGAPIIFDDVPSRSYATAIAAGDIDHDGYGDLILGAWQYESWHGAIYLQRGGPEGLRPPSGPLVPANGGRFGDVLDSGDFNGDGFADVAVGAWGEDSMRGAVYVLYGSTSGLDITAAERIEGNAPADTDGGTTQGHFGAALAATSDVNGDGYADLVCGQPQLHGLEGQVDVILGSATGLQLGAPLVLRGASEGMLYFGQRLAAGADLNSDGYDDIAVRGVTATTSGRVVVRLGESSGLASTSNAISGGESFGRTLGLGFDPAGTGSASLFVADTGSGSVGLYVGQILPPVVSQTAGDSLDGSPDDSFGGAMAP